ncbi:MAG TPA: NUDIX hydrolase [Rhizomicrobium sp.]
MPFRFGCACVRIDRRSGTPPNSRFALRVPEGDTTERYVCGDCGHIYYSNPKIVAGSVVAFGGRVLLCRRAIAPRKGWWTLPAGYLEEHETPARDARPGAILFSIVCSLSIRFRVSARIRRARLDTEQYGADAGSLEVAPFDWDDIPWTEIAFPSVHWALRHRHLTRDQKVFAPFSNPPGESGNFPPR